jgi:hypothetical protein
MGYAGYSPGDRIADKLTPLQQALRALPLAQAQETLELIEKLTRNIVRNPAEDKFRHIKFSNAKIAATIKEVPFAVDVLKEMGWVDDAEGLSLPASVKPLHEKEVHAIIDAKDYCKKEIEKEKHRAMMEMKDRDPLAQELKDKLELDRKERAASGPVTQASVAKKRGDGQVVRAADIGIGKSSGG